MSDEPKSTDKYPLLVIPGYIDSVKGEPLTISSPYRYVPLVLEEYMLFKTLRFAETRFFRSGRTVASS